jgi:hypothetical protein
MGNSPQDLRNRMWIWIAALILIAVACGCIGLAVGGLAGYLIGRAWALRLPPGPLLEPPGWGWTTVSNFIIISFISAMKLSDWTRQQGISDITAWR